MDWYAFRKVEDGNGTIDMTNYHLLLSDQCQHETTCVAYEDTSSFFIKEEVVLTGSIMKQIVEVTNFIRRYLPIKQLAYQTLVERYEHYIPFEAVREVVVNAFLHRDYRQAERNIISVYSDRIEVVSIGAIPSFFHVGDLQLGVTSYRNPQLAQLFKTQRWAQLVGSGMKRIEACYLHSITQPKFSYENGIFFVRLPIPRTRNVEEQCKAIIAFQDIQKWLSERNQFQAKQLAEFLGVSKTSTRAIIQKLCQQQFIYKVGQGPKTSYYVMQQNVASMDEGSLNIFRYE